MPSLTLRTARSAIELVSGRYGVDVSCGKSKSSRAFSNSLELSVKTCLHGFKVGPKNFLNAFLVSAADLFGAA